MATLTKNNKLQETLRERTLMSGYLCLPCRRWRTFGESPAGNGRVDNYYNSENALLLKVALCISQQFLAHLNAQVSFTGHLSSVVSLSICLSVNFSHFHQILQNHWANFNQTWHKVSLGERANEEPHPSQRGNNWEIIKINWQLSKILFSRTTGQI